MTTIYPRMMVRSSRVHNPFVQLLLLALLGVVLPPALWFGAKAQLFVLPQAANTLAATALATLFSWYCLEKLRYFAKARRLSYVFPVNCVTFGLGFAALGVLRLPYSSVVALLTFGSVMAITFVLVAATRHNGTEQCLIPGGSIDELLPELDDFRILSPAKMASLVARPRAGAAVVVDLHHDHGEEWQVLMAEAAINGIPVYHYRQILEMQTGQVRIDHMRENEFGSLIPNLTYTGPKRGFDVAAALFLLPLLLPLFILVAVFIKLDSPGPVFFTQARVGYRGRTFRMLKFRSMRVRALPSDPAARIEDAMTKAGDRRITRVGAFIRRYRIDELPQVLNILVGHMSWIGPRPEEVGLSEMYQRKIPFYRYRHIVRPGITGWAQVNQGHVAAVDEVAEKLRFDFYYVRHISLWLDMLIAMKTLRILMGGFGAR